MADQFIESDPEIEEEKHRHMRVARAIDTIGMSEPIEVRYNNEQSFNFTEFRQNGVFVGDETRYQFGFLLDANGLLDDVERRATDQLQTTILRLDGVAKANVRPLPDHDKVSVRVIFDSSDLKA